MKKKKLELTVKKWPYACAKNRHMNAVAFLNEVEKSSIKPNIVILKKII